MRIKTLLAASGAGLVLLSAGSFAAEVDIDVKPGKGLTVEVKGEQPENLSAKNAKKDKADAVQKAGENVEIDTVYRESQIVGMHVQNRKGEDLGEINDLVLDLHDGKINYAALSFGGVLGLGDKLFAIPWDAMKFRSEENKHFFVLGIDPERLKNAPGFDQDHWPNTADPKWNLETRKRFATTDEAIKPVKVKDAKTDAEATPDYSAVMRVSKVKGMAVKNPDQEDLGTIDELVINVNGGQVRYAALSFGGILGVGDKLFAIPWDALQFKQNADDSFFVLEVSKERLKKAPGFDKDQWPDTANPNWSEEIDAYYQAKREIR